MPDRPNVLFVMADQHRGDAVGTDPACPPAGDGAPVAHTPNIDHLVEGGALFSRAYTPVPSCVPARRCLWTGQGQDSADAPTWKKDPWDFDYTLPWLLRDAGYQTHLAGKSHSQPLRNHFGFEGMDLHAAGDGDYGRMLDRRFDGEVDEVSHGLDRNAWDPRQNHLPEHLHPTNWTTNRALEFLETRDPTRPFFLTVSYHRPHQPFDPPQPYWDLYRERDLAEPDIGEWADAVYGEKIPENPSTTAWCADIPDWIVARARAGYYGSITHIDHQLHRIFDRLGNDTLIVYTSDHGEMLGDHHLWRKTYAYEGSARVPMIVRFPGDADLPRGRTVDRPVGLEDLLPTILDYLGMPVPDAVEGRSLLDLVERPDREDWRTFYHGEHGPIYDPENACQYLVGDRQKYIWNPITHDELLFDLVEDPRETTNLAADSDHEADRQTWRERLIETLADRPEGFVKGGELRTPERGAEGTGRFY